MAVRETGDPRLQAFFDLDPVGDSSVRPLVQPRGKGVPTWLYIAVAAFAAVLLFIALEGRRAPLVQPAKLRSDEQAFTTPPPLYIPPQVEPAPIIVAPAPDPQAPVVVPVSTPATVAVLPSPQPPPVTRLRQAEPLMTPLPRPLEARSASGAPLVLDAGTSPPSSPGTEAYGAGRTPGQGEIASGGRMRASSLANRSTTVAQGTLIPAVLETAFDSTRAGLARAIVSRDIRSFDGSNVLIPRGSRLVGQYKSEVSAGQNRAVISWTRLIRADGVTILLDSPAVDPLGRGGIPAHVNTHFLTRFADGLINTTLGLGSNLAMRATTRNVVVALPGTFEAATPTVGGNNNVPTLTVPAGKTISVFVAHDLDFSFGKEAR